jgi:CRP-like cAMP-binding protein
MQMSAELVAVVDRNATCCAIKAGTILFRRGDPVSAVYVIRSGRLALEWCAGENVLQLDFAGPGNLVGLPAAFKGEYCLSARAAEDTELGFVPHRWAIELLERDARLSLAATRIVSRELTKMRRTPFRNDHASPWRRLTSMAK